VEPWVAGALLLVWVTLVVWVVTTLLTIRREVERVKAAGAARGEAIRVIQTEVEAIQAAVAAMGVAAMGAEVTAAMGEAVIPVTQAMGTVTATSPIATTDTVTTLVTTTPITQEEAAAATAAATRKAEGASGE